ncbi:hypothetical protein DMC18_02640 [Caulobacter sp. D5]|uniref:hypothetical protein n=1 Tax=Caulobacter sp. D5 TaxID=357400 RepID=UPI000D72A42F|nr:hypothetical protein [Caulobacter sp. D5]PXA96038.1 hypothetical protein DMC18_02640 [Caulobacter sp. D5]
MTYRIVKCYDRLSGAFAGYLSTHGNNVTVVSDEKDATPFNWYHYGSDLYLTKNSSPARYLGEAGGKRADWGLWAGDYCAPVIYNADSSVSLASAPGRRLRLPSGDDRVFWSDDDTATDILQIDLGHPRAWLANVPGTTLIGDINLPGTHDSAAIDKKKVTPYSCHYRTITQQLEAGVRLLDVRLMIKTNPSGPPAYTFMTCHGNVGLGHEAHVYQTFHSLLVECRDFLAAYPSEFIAMSLKIDDQNAVPDADMPAVLTALDAVLANELIAPSWPTAMLPLATMRGKIYLLDRIVPACSTPTASRRWRRRSPRRSPPTAMAFRSASTTTPPAS